MQSQKSLDNYTINNQSKRFSSFCGGSQKLQTLRIILNLFCIYRFHKHKIYDIFIDGRSTSFTFIPSNIQIWTTDRVASITEIQDVVSNLRNLISKGFYFIYENAMISIEKHSYGIIWNRGLCKELYKNSFSLQKIFESFRDQIGFNGGVERWQYSCCSQFEMLIQINQSECSWILENQIKLFLQIISRILFLKEYERVLASNLMNLNKQADQNLLEAYELKVHQYQPDTLIIYKNYNFDEITQGVEFYRIIQDIMKISNCVWLAQIEPMQISRELDY
ncbi:unnamed protein product [Paramecium octaurelia]|uniref:Uncharacterized protein n=1 Tax=Paramecium octaurelia TaxID=43137 RepID=A0A8S1VZ44_PAROT|nr:unnamed protein product [Paramecium octaurelia]